MVDEVDGAGLCVFPVDFQSPHPCRVINGSELEAPNLFTARPFESQELDVHLNVVTGNLLVVTLGMDLAQAGAARKTVDATAFQYSRDGCI